jgi:hypothetical protein
MGRFFLLCRMAFLNVQGTHGRQPAARRRERKRAMRQLMARCRRFGLLCAALVACWPIQGARAAPETAATNPDGIMQDVFSGDFYRVRPDFRRCAAPLCGGYWVALVNRPMTTCADGTPRRECYVARIDWASPGAVGAASVALVRGELQDRHFPGFGPLGVLVASDAWRAAGRGSATGTWYGLRDAGIRCFTTPCFSIDERTLNSPRTRRVSAVDLEGVDASPEDRRRGYDAVWEEDGLIATGRNVTVRNAGPAGDGVTMVASQFFLKLRTHGEARGIGSPDFCRKDSDCTASRYTRFVSSPKDCYCLFCPSPVSVAAAALNEASWQQHCRGLLGSSPLTQASRPAPMLCPAIACIAIWIEPRCERGLCVSGLHRPDTAS